MNNFKTFLIKELIMLTQELDDDCVDEMLGTKLTQQQNLDHMVLHGTAYYIL